MIGIQSFVGKLRRGLLLILAGVLLPAAPALAGLAASMSIETGFPNPISLGDITAYKISLTNSNNASAVTGTGFTDTLPSHIVVAGVGVATYTCTNGDGSAAVVTGTVTAGIGGNTITLANGTIPIAAASSGSCDIVVEVTSRTPSDQGTAPLNSISAGAVSGSDNTGAVSNSSPAQQSITINTLNNPTITKSFSPTTIVRNDQTTQLTIVISNSNNATKDLPLNTLSDSPAFAIQDLLPSSLQVAATPAASSTCTGVGVAPSFSPNAGDTTLTAVGGTVAAAGTCTLKVNVIGTSTVGGSTPADNVPYGLGLSNTISRTTGFGNERGLVPPSDATANLTVNSAMQVSKAFSPTTVAAGQNATLTITLHNGSVLNPLTGVQLTENNIKTSGSGAGVLTISNAVLSGCGAADIDFTVNGNKGFALGGATPATINAGSSCVITITYSASLAVAGTPETFTDTIAEGTVVNSDPTIISNRAVASVTVVDQLTVSKTSNPATVAPGNPVQYTVTVNNYSVTTLSNVRITDVLPAGMYALPASPAAPSLSGPGCSGLTNDILAPPATTTPHFTIGSVPAGTGPNPGVCTVTFWAMAPSSGSGNVNNTIGAGGVCDNNGAGTVCNHSASNTASATLSNVLTVSKAFNPSSASEGTVSLLTVTYTNLSAQPMTAASFTDNLPVGSTGLQLVVANPANASSTCSGATITALPGASSVAISGATIPARASNGTGAFGSCVLNVNVIGAAGNYTNTLAAGALTATETLADTTTRTASSPGPVSASLTYSSALTATKSFAPTIIQSGGKSTVTIHLGNVGSGTLNNVSVIDPLPNNMAVASPSNAHTTCGGATTITAAAGATTPSISGAVIPNGGQCDFVFDVTGTGGSNWVNSIPTGNITATGGVQNVNPVTATLTNNTTGGLTVTNGTSPNNLTAPGQTSVLTITLNNSGAVTLSSLSLTDYFTNDGSAGGALSGLLISGTPSAATTCPGGVVSAVAGGTSVSLSGATLIAGGGCTVSVNVTLRTVGTVQNIIPVSAVTTAQGISNTLPTTTSLSALANLGITKQFIPAVIKPGQRSQLLITFINPLALPVTNLSVTDTLPPGLTIPAGPNASTTCLGATVSAPTAGSVSISNGSLPAANGGASATCVAVIDVFAAAIGTFNNVIGNNTVTSTVGGSAASNPVPATATLLAANPVVIAKSFSPTQVSTGTPSTLTITLSNSNNIPLTAAAFIDSFPANLAVALTPAASTTCGGVVTAAASATTVALAGGTIPATGSCQVQVNVVSNVPGIYTNTIPASQLTTAQGVSNENPASALITVSTPPTVTKQFSPAVISAGGTSTLTLTLSNGNTAPTMTLSTALVDTLPTAPGNVVVAATPNVQKTCPGAVTAVAGAGSITYANGATIPVAGCTISVDVTAAAPGTYNNTIVAGALQTNLGNNLQPANGSLLVSTLGYISGKVFQDNNVTPNGTFESGTDTPLSGVTIELLNASNAVIATTVTDINGNYLFAGLAAGTYSILEPSQPTGTVNGITTAGSIIGSGGTPGAASSVATTPSVVANIVLASGPPINGSVNNNFAEVVLSSLSGTVFLDQNNDGIQQGADAGIAGVTIQLQNAVNTVIATTTTDASGNYSFSGLAPGTYSVLEPTQPTATSNGITTAGAVLNGGTAGTATTVATTPSRIANIVLPPNTTASANNFAEIPNGRTLSGVVFLDYNNDGAIDGSDHGIGGQTINLSGTDINSNAVSRSTTTAADGSYSFAGLPPGTYTVTQPAQPTGTTNGITSVGSTGGTATIPAVTPSAISAINLTNLNTVSANNNFAELPGAASDLTLTKTHSPANFAQASSSGYYTITPGNIGALATTGAITIVDTLPAGMTLAATASGSGWSCPAAVGASVVTCTSTTAIGAGVSGNPITLRVAVAAGLAGQILTNSATISGGGEPAGFNGNNTAIDPTPIATAASVQGTVWLDSNHNRILDAGETRVAGWGVDLLLNGVLVATTTTDASGAYSFTGLAPGSGYQVRFRDPASGAIYGKAVPNETGASYVSGTVSAANPAGADNSNGTLNSMTLLAGTNTVQQSLPLDPSGVVYDAVTRVPVAGATVTISGPAGFNPAVDLVGGSSNVSQLTGADGYYQFLLLAAAPAGTYSLTVAAPAGYLPAPSTLIPACTPVLTVGAAPNPALVQNSSAAPSASSAQLAPGLCPAGSAGLAATATTTQYYFNFNFNAASANIVNNHIPIDPVLGGAIVVTKTTPRVNVARGDLVPYTVTATNTLAVALANINIDDRIPPGFRYRTGSGVLNGVRLEPTVSNRDLIWRNLTFAPGERKTFQLLLVVGAGVGETEYVNQAWALNNLIGSLVSNVASATVRVIPDPTFDCSDIIGKVFDDKNANGYQDPGEPGIPNVRVVAVRGLLVTTDSEGRFHVACADIPQEDHGSNFVMKLDERTLPSGYRLTTENPRDVRVTRGKLVKLEFGATVHRVFRLDLSAAAFAAGGSDLLPTWNAQLEKLPAHLSERPSVLRIAYTTAKDEAPALAQQRLDAVADRMRKLWRERKDGAPSGLYPLIIETELDTGR